MIIFEDVHKSFGPKKVLNGLNLRVSQDEVLFILGRSGTGKSVALKHLVGLLRADSGRISIDGEAIEKLNEQAFFRIRRKCGLVFQLPALLDSRTLFENLVLGVRELSVKEKVARVRRALDDVKLTALSEHLTTKFPPQISYGEQKRMAIARSLVIDPDYLLYDEPTTGLDPITSRSIHDLIRDIAKNRGKTAIVVSHDMRNALATADRLVLLDAGQVVDEGSPREIRSSHLALTREFMEDLHDATPR